MRRRRPVDPRRAAHARPSTGRSATGATARSTTRCTSREAGAQRLALFHHDPAHGDDELDADPARRGATTRPRVGAPEVHRGVRGPRARRSPPQRCRRCTDESGVAAAHARRRIPPPIRTVLGHFATGVTVITAIDGDEPVGMACNSFTSVSLDPPLVLFCAAKSSTTWPRIQAAGKWAANILAEDGEEICRLFAREGRRPLRAHRVHDGPERFADPRRRARVRRLRDDRRARRRRPHDRRRPGARARLRARRQAAALLPRRLRPLRDLTTRGSRVGRARRVATREAGRRHNVRRSGRPRGRRWWRRRSRRPRRRARGSSRRARCRSGRRSSRRAAGPRRQPSWARTVGTGRLPPTAASRLSGRRGAIQRSKTTWMTSAFGPGRGGDREE